MKYLSLLCVSLAAFGLTACGAETYDTTTDDSEITQTRDYIGLSVSEAMELAEQNNVAFRVIMADGEGLAATMDYRPGRINAETENNIVTAYTVEGQEQNDEIVMYDSESWKTMIPETCMSYSDGCNTCKKNPESDIAGCTRMFCEVYEKPTCLDDLN